MTSLQDSGLKHQKSDGLSRFKLLRNRIFIRNTPGKCNTHAPWKCTLLGKKGETSAKHPSVVSFGDIYIYNTCIYTVYTFHYMFLFIDWCIWPRFAVCMFCQSFLAADWISRRSSKKCGDPFQCEKPEMRWDEMKPMTKHNQQVCSFCRNSWQHHSICFASLSSIPKRLIKIDQNELQFLLSNMIFKKD